MATRTRSKELLVLGRLRTGTLFKVTESRQIGVVVLTVEAVYQIGTAKADRGRKIKIRDLAGLRKRGTGFVYE
jgi:hypothetical protein